jgi:hypothetical protein
VKRASRNRGPTYAESILHFRVPVVDERRQVVPVMSAMFILVQIRKPQRREINDERKARNLH